MLFFYEYKKALATFGAEPLPLPEPVEGPKGVVRILGWLINEFKGL